VRRILTIALLLAAACTDEDRSRKTLDNLGFTDVVFTGYQPFACGDDYVFETGFKAKNPNGKSVEGVVCCGALKGCSVKF
jgi:hypothetical protein